MQKHDLIDKLKARLSETQPDQISPKTTNTNLFTPKIQNDKDLLTEKVYLENLWVC